MTRHAGLLLALAVAAAAVAYQYHHQQDNRSRFDRFSLPAFDAYVYVAMAEQPAFFTVAPWGYRILTPWIAHAFPRKPLATYRRITVSALILSGGLLFLYLRRLGHAGWAALLGVAALSLSAPVGEAIEAPFLGEPVALLLELALLLAVESGAGLASLSLLLALMAFSKEIFVLFLPLVYWSARKRAGTARALLNAALASAPAMVVILTLRHYWVPHIQPPHAPLDLGLARQFAISLLADWRETGGILLLGGLAPLALLGALRRSARPYLRRAGYLAPATIAAALFAWINVPSERAVILLGSNVRRLLLYALPILIPLGLVALDRVVRQLAAPTPAGRPRRWLERLSVLGVAGCLAFPFVALDRYRRVPLHAARSGIRVLAVCHESLVTARKLERGEPVVWDVDEMRFDPATALDDSGAKDLRWFLREGWGAEPLSGEARIVGASGSFLLPTLTPRDRELVLSMSGVASERITLRVNGEPLGTAVVTAGAIGDHSFRVPARVLFRGDNLVTLQRGDGAPQGPHLFAIEIRASSR